MLNFAQNNLPSLQELEIAANVCSRLADLTESLMPWYERIFYSCNNIRKIGQKIRKIKVSVDYFNQKDNNDN